MKRLQHQDAHRLLQTNSVLLEKNTSVQIQEDTTGNKGQEEQQQHMSE